MRGPDGRNPSVNAVALWIRRAGDRATIPAPDRKTILDPAEADKLNQIKNVLAEANIPIESIGRIQHVHIRSGFHEVVTKDQDGNPIVTKSRSKNTKVLLSPKWAEGPQWPLLQPAQTVIVRNPPLAKPPPKDTKTIVVISDVQVGFLRDVHDLTKLTAMHDERAITVALQIVQDLRPSQIGYVGDFLDFPEMSRWLQLPEFIKTTQPAIDAGHRILAQFEAAAGPGRAPTFFIAGNHDRRLREYLVKNAMAAYGLRPAQLADELAPPDDGHTVPWALRFKELGIEYVGEYPGGEHWLTPKLVVRHNPESKTAYDASVIAGHTHRIRRETFSRRTEGGPVHNTLYEIGCLCELGQYGDNTSLMATRVPSNRSFVKDWAQGFAVVTVAPDESFTVEQVEITGGRALFRGKVYAA